MPVHNTAPYVRGAIDSILAQTFRDFELLVIDDASTDESANIVREIVDSRVHLLQNERNLGPAASRNRALDVARGKYIAFFDSDDLADSRWLETELKFLTDNSQYKGVGAWCETIDAEGNSTGIACGYGNAPDRLPATMLFYNCLPTSTLLLEKAAIAGLRFRAGMAVASDYDLWVRLLEQFAFFVLPKALHHYRVHAENVTHRKRHMADDCLRQIMVVQLERLGLHPAQAELELHLRLMQFTYDTPKETVLAVESWLLKLASANEKMQFYAGQPFMDVLCDRWYDVCHSACGHGWWTWSTFSASPLRQGVRVHYRRQSKLIYLVLRAVIKSSFPSLSSTLRGTRS